MGEMDDELSILEYARTHGLCRDFTREFPLVHLTEDDAVWPLTTTYEALPPLLPLTERKNITLDDKWSVEIRTARFIRDIIQIHLQEGHQDHEAAQNPKHLRLELPLLSGDADLEHKKWQARQDHMMIDLSTVLQLQIVEAVPENARYPWPLMDNGLIDRIQSKVSSERLSVGPHALELLKEIMISDHVSSDDFSDDTRRSQHRLSPPWLPLSPPPTIIFGEGFTPDLDIPLTSSPENPAERQLQGVQNAILFDPQDERCEQGKGLLSDSPLASPHKRERPQDLRLDLPLSPRTDSESPFKKAKMADLVSPSLEALTEASVGSDERRYNQFFDDLVDLSTPVVKQLENEQLLEADNTLRVPLPHITCDDPLAPWLVFSSSNSREPLRACKDTFHEAELQWPHVGLRSLRWNPIPVSVSPAQLITDEFDEEEAARYVDELSLVDADGDCFSWKQPGLRILDKEEGEDSCLELMPVPLGDEMDLARLVHSRQQPGPEPISLLPAERPKSTFAQPTTANALDSFFNTHTGQPVVRTALPPTKFPPQAVPRQIAAPAPLSVTHPPINARPAPQQIIVSETLLPSRHLLSNLKALLPQTTFLERSWDHTEADISPAPRIGLLFTSLQSLKQRQLPGQPAQPNSVVARVADLRGRYRSLILFVAAGATVDASDIAALNAITASDISVLLTPSSPEGRAEWAASVVCGLGAAEWSVTGDGYEVTGEALLRAAGLDGMSAFAALSLAGSMAALAATTPLERAHLLGPVLGSKAVSRLDALLDSPWGR